MMTNRRHQKIMAGNWKMNQDLGNIRQFSLELNQVKAQLRCKAWIAPQFVHIPILKDLAFTLGNFEVGAQNCSEHDRGAFTGEVSAATLADMGTRFVIIGHSERRALYGESNELLAKKIAQCLKYDLDIIYCVGETLEENQSGRTQEVLRTQIKEGLRSFPLDQLELLHLAYEPVWAIGTGKTATPETAQSCHHFIRQELVECLGALAQDVPVLYGGSVKPDNLSALLQGQDVDGALVGGASLVGKDFVNMCLTATQYSA